MPVFTHSASDTFEVGNKEFYSNIIDDISPMTTPILGMIGRETVDSQLVEYYTADMETPSSEDADFAVQGADPSPSVQGRFRVYNRMGIFQTSCKVADSEQTQKKVGNISELDWNVGRRLVKQKQSLEQSVLTRVRMQSPSTNSAKGLFQGLPGIAGAWSGPAQTEQSIGLGNSNTTNIDVTIEDLSDDLTGSTQGMGRVDGMIQRLWENGADVSVLVMSAANKKNIDQWDTSGITRNTNQLSRLVEKIDGYEGSFGAIKMIPSRWLSIHTDTANDEFDAYGGGAATNIRDFAIMFQPEMAKLLVMEGDDWHSEELARTGRNREIMISGQFSLKYDNPSGLGLFSFASWTTHTNTVDLPTNLTGAGGARDDFDLS
jgi:hypothetical protein